MLQNTLYKQSPYRSTPRSWLRKDLFRRASWRPARRVVECSRAHSVRPVRSYCPLRWAGHTAGVCIPGRRETYSSKGVELDNKQGVYINKRLKKIEDVEYFSWNIDIFPGGSITFPGGCSHNIIVPNLSNDSTNVGRAKYMKLHIW